MKLSIASLVVVLTFGACKKGENDPFSLASRKARICGEWTVSNEVITSSNSYTSMGITNTNTYNSTYNGQTQTSVSVNNGTTYNDSYNYTIDVEIKKDGTFTLTQREGANVYTNSGVWSFVGKSKTAELKNKEAILLYITKEEENSGGEIYTYTLGEPNGNNSYLMVIDKLSKKEIVFKSENQSTSTNSNGFSSNSSYSRTTTWTAK